MPGDNILGKLWVTALYSNVDGHNEKKMLRRKKRISKKFEILQQVFG